MNDDAENVAEVENAQGSDLACTELMIHLQTQIEHQHQVVDDISQNLN